MTLKIEHVDKGKVKICGQQGSERKVYTTVKFEKEIENLKSSPGPLNVSNRFDYIEAD